MVSQQNENEQNQAQNEVDQETTTSQQPSQVQNDTQGQRNNYFDLANRISQRHQEDMEFERDLLKSRGTIREKAQRREERMRLRHQEDVDFFTAYVESPAPAESVVSAAPQVIGNQSELDLTNLSHSRFKITLPRLKSLTDIYEHESLKDWVHQIESNGLQGECRKLIERSAMDAIKRKVSADQPDEAVFRYLQERLVSAIGERSKIRYWAKKIEFSVDFTRPIEDRIDQFFMDAAEGEQVIDGCRSDLDVKRAYIMKLCLKLDPRLNLNQKWLIDNPQIKTLESLKEKALEVKARADEECEDTVLQKLYDEGLSTAYTTPEEQRATVKFDNKRIRLLLGKRKASSVTPKETEQPKKKQILATSTSEGSEPWRSELNVVKTGLSDLTAFIKAFAEKHTPQSGSSKSKSKKKKKNSQQQSPSNDDAASTTSDDGPVLRLRFFSDKVGASKEKYFVYVKSKHGPWRSSKGCLDSGAETSVGVLERHESYCQNVRRLDSGTLQLQPWSSSKIMKPTHVGYMPIQVRFYHDGKERTFTFTHDVKVYLVPEKDMRLGKSDIDLLIGEPAISREGIMPLDALKNKVMQKEKGSKSRSRDRDRERHR